MKKLLGIIMVLSFFALPQGEAIAQTLNRADVGVEDTWDLTQLYPNDEAWMAQKDEVAAQFEDILQYKGKLAESPQQLLACLKLSSTLNKEFSRLYGYASLSFDQDTRNAEANGKKQQMQQLGTEFGAKAAFIEPEILAIDKAKIEEFIAAEKDLKVFEFYLNDLQRQKKHRLSEKEEKILAQSGLVTGLSYSAYGIFTNAELPYASVTLSDGSTQKINQSGYGRYRAVKNRDDRIKVFETFFTTLNKFRQTTGTLLDGAVKRDMFYARTRGYESSLHAALDANNIPVEVYHSLIENVDKNIGTFHRYLKLRQRMLKVDTLYYHDMYPSVVGDVDLKYTIDEAKAMTLESLKPLGKEYQAAVKEGFDNRWMDAYPTEGKRSGAYMSPAAFDVHPYVLLNFNGQYNDVSTLAHEFGHAMQTYFSNKTQPYELADYPIFVAEVASTFNEELLIRQELEKIKDDDVRLSLLMSQLDGIKGTVFRQTQFAEFELKMHETAEKGMPLTGDTLTEIYAKIVRKYYGHDQGICIIPDLYTVEWAYIPHFYYNFYVYQYATSYTASIALSEAVLAGEKGAKDHYMEFLSAG
ncbi:oligoendopeptidase F, partial [bacterium]|nr:oligoendopeptidase F [bacterium]